MSQSPGNRRDPLPAFCFKVTLDDEAGVATATAFFKSVGGLKYETELTPVKVGGMNDTVVQLPNGGKWSNITLKRGFSGDEKLIAWRDKWMKGAGQGQLKRVNGTITQLNTAYEEVFSWTFKRAMPITWELSELDASKNEVAIETLVLAHEGIIQFTKIK